MAKPKIRISLHAYMMDRLARDNKLIFRVGEQEYEICLADFRMELIWAEDGKGQGQVTATYTEKKLSEMN